MKRLHVKAVLALLTLAGLTVAYQSDHVLFERPERRIKRYERRLGRRLMDKHGIFLLLTFDEPVPVEWVSQNPVNMAGVERVPGRFRWARRFDGYNRTSIDAMREWQHVGNRFSISTWIKLEPAAPYQDILFSGAHRGRVGLRLNDGQMTFHIPPWDQQISYPFESFGEFTHIAAVADAEEGMAYLYENGILKASAAVANVEPPNHNVEFGKTRWYVARDPLFGVIDETVIWQRALAPGEIRDLANARDSLLLDLKPKDYRRRQFWIHFRNTVRTTLKTLDAFNPFLHPGRVMTAAIPDVRLQLSNSDLRRLMRTHAASRNNGRRTQDASNARATRFVADGQGGAGRLRLHGGNSWYDPGERMALELESDDGSTFLGLRRVLLAPPETAGFLAPLFETRMASRLGLPHVNNGLCRLTVNDIFMGVYYFKDYERMGVYPGSGSRLFFGPRSPLDWMSRFHGNASEAGAVSPLNDRLPLSGSEVRSVFDRVVREYFPLLASDAASPVSSREIRYHVRRQRKELPTDRRDDPDGREPAHCVVEALTPFMLLGDNPSPFYLTGDLNLSVLPDAGIEWHSSAPEILSPCGRVVRPAGTTPREVSLTARVTAADRACEKELVFRVMPLETLLPAFMFYANEQLNKIVRVDSIAHYYPPGTNIAVPRVLKALQETRGGLSHRGGSSYWNHKKPFSLRVAEAHRILDDSNTRHIFFTPGCEDPTFMRNKISYDLFRSFSAPGAPRHAPEIFWAELFVNGRYHGLYEIKTRVQRRMLGFPSYNPERDHNAKLYKVLDVRAGIRTGTPYAIVQKLPQRRWGYHGEPYFELMRFLDAAEKGEAAAEIAARFDLENAVDFHLFVNMTEGRDSINVNFFIARGPEPGDRFFFVVYDCDKNLQSGGKRWYRNRMVSLLTTPDFDGILPVRWRELRDGPARPEILLAHIDAMETILQGYVGWERERWGNHLNRSFAEHVERLRNIIRRRYEFLDEELGPPRG